MKPVEFEIIMRDGTREGMQSASGNVDVLNAKIVEQRKLVTSLEQDLGNLQKKLSQATTVSNADDIASIETLQTKIKELQASLIELENQKEKGNDTPFIPPKVNDQFNTTKSRMNMLSFNVQQVARELPSLALGPQMFFLAISNNIPTLTDQIKLASIEYKNLTAAGQKATPVWKQVLGSIFSWQTAMIVGITVLVAYGKQITEWTANLFKSKDAITANTIALEQLTAARLKGAQSAQAELTRLKLLYQASQDESIGKKNQLTAIKKLQSEYPSYFGNLSAEQILAGKAASAYMNLAKSILASAQARAVEDKIVENSKKILELNGQIASSGAERKSVEGKFNKSLAADPNLVFQSDNSSIYDESNKKYEQATKERERLISVNKKLAEKISVTDLIADPKEKPKKEKKTPSTENLTDKIADATVKAQQRIDLLKLAAMEDGANKEKALARSKFDEEIDRIDIEERERLQALAKAKKMKLPVSQEQIDTVTNQADTQRALAADSFVKSFSDIEEKTKKQEKELWDEINVHFKSSLDQRLYEIDKNYNEQVEKAKGNKEIIDALNANRTQDKKVETNKSSLDELDYQEQIELQRREIQLRGLTSDEYVEQQRNAIILKYAKARIKILETMKDDDSKRELGTLKNTVSGIENDKKPKTLKNIVDTKAIEALTKHYVKLGNAEEDAKTKAENFATGYTQKMQLASEVTGTLKSAFGGIDKNLDVALDAVDNIASGFANGGIVGGIAAAASTVISVTKNLLTARKEMSAGMVAEYKVYVETLNSLIDKQIDLLDQLGGNAFGKNIAKTTNDIVNEMNAARKLLAEAAAANSGIFTRSYGTRMNKVLVEYRRQLEKIGIYTTDWSKLTNDQLIQLKQIPELYAKIPEKMREYIDDLSDATDKLEDFKEQVQETILGFNFEDITSMIVDSVTDPSIDNALNDLSDNVQGTIAKIVKSMLTRNLLTNQIQTLLSTLMDSMTVTTYKGRNGSEITGYDLKQEAAKQFADGVIALGTQYKDAYDKLKEQFKAAGIDFDASTNASQTSQTGTITTISEETGSKLEGTMVALVNRSAGIDENGKDLARLMTAALTPLNQIAENTIGCKRIEGMANDIAIIKRDGLKLK